MPVAAHFGPLSRGVARSARCTDQLLEIKGSAALGRVRIKTKLIGTGPSPLVGQVALESESAQRQLNAASDHARVRTHRGVSRPTLWAGFFDESEGIIALNLNHLATGSEDSGAQEGGLKAKALGKCVVERINGKCIEVHIKPGPCIDALLDLVVVYFGALARLKNGVFGAKQGAGLVVGPVNIEVSRNIL